MRVEDFISEEQVQEVIQRINEVNEALAADKNEEALELADALEFLADKLLDNIPDDMPIAYDFENLFQELFYRFRAQKYSRQARAILPMSRILLLHGIALMRLGEYEEAQPLLERATGWNPVGPRAALAYAECCKELDDRAKFFVITKEILTYATQRDELARCYRNLGWYFTCLGEYEAAKGCYLFSLTWEQEPKVQQELAYIDQQAGRHIEDPNLEELKSFADTFNFQLGPDHDVVGLAYSYGREMLAQRQYDSARYFLNIVDQLIEDDGIKAMLAQIDKEENAPQQV